MIMFLHGPGGSGKSAVMELVCQCDQGYCELLDYPFMSNTIVTTAMTGVAATLLKGETLHRKCCLAKKVRGDNIAKWRHTRLLIVDEISFASWEEMEDLDKKTQELMKRGEG